MEDKIFCQKCEQRLPSQSGGFMSMIDKKQKVHEFKDGFYCEKCAKVKVEEGRK